MKTNKRLRLLLFIAIFSLCSCQRPQEQMSFIYTDGTTSDGDFLFSMDIVDSLTSYSSEIVCKYRTSLIRSDEIDLCIELTSPSDLKYGEIVTLPLSENSRKLTSIIGKKFGSSAESRWSYRDNISTSETGVWKIKITPLHKEILEGIYGIGFSYKVIL